MSMPPIPVPYAQVFRESLDELDGVLKEVKGLFFRQWHSIFRIIELRSDGAAEANRSWNPEGDFYAWQKSAQFCHFIRSTLGRKDLCEASYAIVSEQVANSGYCRIYKCPWNLWVIAVPIMLHGFCVGIIVSGQKVLEGDVEADDMGELEEFARQQGLERCIPALRRERKLAGTTTRADLEKMRRFFWATANYISRIIQLRLDKGYPKLEVSSHKKAYKFLNSISALSDNSDKIRFWNDLRPILDGLKDMLDSRCIAVCYSTRDKVQLLLTAGLSLPAEASQTWLPEQLITQEVDPSSGPMRKAVRFPSVVPSCPLSATVLAAYPQIDMILHHRSDFAYGRSLHFIVFLESVIARRHNLSIVQKEMILDDVIRTTKNAFSFLEVADGLKEALDRNEWFLNDVVHQINQPLQSLVARCDNLMSSEFPQEKRTSLPVFIRESAIHLAMLVRNLEILTRGERSFEKLVSHGVQEFSLSNALIACALHVQGFGTEQRVDVHVDVTTTDPLGRIRVDERLFEIAMTNILFNAVKYSYPDTSVKVAAYQDHSDKKLIIATTNMGIPIPDDMSYKIFEKSVRTAEARRHSFSGLGIGLYVTRIVVELMGGTVYVVSSEPIGGVVRMRQGQERQVFKTSIAIALPARVAQT